MCETSVGCIVVQTPSDTINLMYAVVWSTATICFEQIVTTKMGVLSLQKFAQSGYYSSCSFRHHHLQYHRPSREGACAEQTHI